MDCREVENLLSERSLAQLAPLERRAIAEHVQGCQPCREKWGFDQNSQILHAQAEALRAQSDVTRDVMARIAQEEASRPAKGEGGAGAAAELKRLGGFELLGRLGKGGMGTVLKARQVSMDRLVALKILPRKLAQNEAFVKRFVREARAAAALHHPNIVQAYDVGLTEGYYYFAMEYIEGGGLDAVLLREGPLEQNRALALMKQAASALAHAHGKGIVHRDIKPSNLMLDSQGTVRITDFGLAKHVEGDIAVTADGCVLGTPAYVSPEMASGKGAGPGSDLYSLGATFFHLLGGRSPFEGQSFSEVLIKQVNEAPPPLAGLAPRVDRRFCHVIDRLLRKSPQARFPSAQALLEALDGLGELHSPTETPTRTLSDEERLKHQEAQEALQRRQARKRRMTTLGTLAACGLLVLAIALGSRGPRQQSHKEDVAKAELRKTPPPPAPTPDPREASVQVRAKADTGPRPPIPPPREPTPPPEPKPQPPDPAPEPTPGPQGEAKVPPPVSFTAPSDSKGLTPVPLPQNPPFAGTTVAGKAALYVKGGPLAFRVDQDFAKHFHAGADRTAFLTFTLLDACKNAIEVRDGHNPTLGPHYLQGTGKWVQVAFDLPRAQFADAGTQGVGFYLRSGGPDGSPDLYLHQVTLSAEGERPPEVPAGLEQGLAVAFYEGQNHERFRAAELASQIAWSSGLAAYAPALGVPVGRFSMRVVGWLYTPEAGQHTFQFYRTAGARLYLDGRVVIDEFSQESRARRAIYRGAWTGNPHAVQLARGWHRLWVEHTAGDDARLVLSYSCGDRGGVVPSRMLYCERELTERIRRDPSQDPLAGLKPTDKVREPQDTVNLPNWSALQAEGERINAAELAIPAWAAWYGTGLLIAKSQRYDLTASGRWGQAAFKCTGPDGEQGGGTGQLVARVGGDLKELDIGHQASFVAQHTGILCLGFRDCKWDDNWGFMLVSVKGPLVADKDAPLLSRFSKLLARGQVDAQKDWAASEAEVERGDRILITATGTWACAGQTTDANGSDRVINDRRAGMLIGRIGEQGVPFMVGALHVLEAPEAGKLYLRMNAVDPAGNSGSVAVTIRSMPKP